VEEMPIFLYTTLKNPYLVMGDPQNNFVEKLKAGTRLQLL